MLKKQTKKDQEVNLLTLKPRRLRQSETDQEGNEVILIPRFGKHRLGRWLKSRTKQPYHRLSLDQLGTFAWQRFDGQTEVATIADSLRQQFGEKVEPIYDRLGLFIKQLLRAKMITLNEDQERNI